MEEKETYLDILNKQWGSGKFWIDLHKHGNFNKEKFLMKEDVEYIAKKAQSDAYEKVIEKFSGTTFNYIIPEIELLIKELWREE